MVAKDFQGSGLQLPYRLACTKKCHLTVSKPSKTDATIGMGNNNKPCPHLWACHDHQHFCCSTTWTLPLPWGQSSDRLSKLHIEPEQQPKKTPESNIHIIQEQYAE